MIKNVSKVAIVAAALVALPGMAQAGTATATGTATLTVINQCTVTGATVNLGSYTTSNTWANVGIDADDSPTDGMFGNTADHRPCGERADRQGR